VFADIIFAVESVEMIWSYGRSSGEQEATSVVANVDLPGLVPTNSYIPRSGYANKMSSEFAIK